MPKNPLLHKIYFSGCVIGTPVNFGGMTGRALAIMNFFLKIVRSQKSYIFKRTWSDFDGTHCI
jgi:hypothetical protein